MMTIPESYVILKCGACGHADDFMEFRKTPIGGELPGGQHQCPKCGTAWKYENITKGKWHANGLYIPPGRKYIRIPSTL